MTDEMHHQDLAKRVTLTPTDADRRLLRRLRRKLGMADNARLLRHALFRLAEREGVLESVPD